MSLCSVNLTPKHISSQYTSFAGTSLKSSFSWKKLREHCLIACQKSTSWGRKEALLEETCRTIRKTALTEFIHFAELARTGFPGSHKFATLLKFHERGNKGEKLIWSQSHFQGSTIWMLPVVLTWFQPIFHICAPTAILTRRQRNYLFIILTMRPVWFDIFKESVSQVFIIFIISKILILYKNVFYNHCFISSTECLMNYCWSYLTPKEPAA